MTLRHALALAALLAPLRALPQQAPQAPQAPSATPQAPQAPQAPQTPQTPQGGQQSTTVVIPPPPGQAPVVVQPQERPVTVAPCPQVECPPPRVVYRDRPAARRRDPVVTIITDALLGTVAGAAVGAAVGLAQSDDTRHEWERDVGTGAVAGFAVGGAVGGVVAYLDYDHDRRVEGLAARELSNRPMTTVAMLGGRF